MGREKAALFVEGPKQWNEMEKALKGAEGTGELLIKGLELRSIKQVSVRLLFIECGHKNLFSRILGKIEFLGVFCQVWSKILTNRKN